jgi:hypothetical protein
MKQPTQKEKYTNEAYVIPSETDVLNFVTKSSTKDQRRKFGIGDLFINAAVCKKCNDYIRSKHRHDFVTCKCGEIFVDGGSWYQRLGNPQQAISIIEEFYDSDKE